MAKRTAAPTITVDELLVRLNALGDAKVRAQTARRGAGANQFGVKLGDLRTLANTIKKHHALALQLWDTGNADARLLATLLLEPKKLSIQELDRMVRSAPVVLPGVRRLHVTVRARLDHGDGAPAGMTDADRNQHQAGNRRRRPRDR